MWKFNARKVDWHIGALFLVPVILLIINDAWIYNANGVDAWSYYGHFFNWPDLVALHPYDYIGTRLSFIVPGYIINTLFNPIEANIVFNLLIYWSSTFAFYAILKKLTTVRIAFFTTLLFATHVAFVSASGWTYVDGAGIAYLLLATFCLLYGITAQKYRAVWLVVAGMMFANLFYTNLFLAIFGVSLFYLFVRLNTQKDYIALTAWAAAGFIAMTVTLGFISSAFGNDFLFFMPSIEFMTNQVQNLDTDPVVPTRPWLPFADHIVLPFFAVLIVFLNIRAKQGFYAREISIYYLIVFASFLVLQFVGIRVLQVRFYTTYLLPSSFLVLGVYLDYMLQSLNTRQFTLVMIGGVLVSILPFASTHWRWLARNADVWPNPILLSVIAISIGFATFGVMRRFGAWGLVAGVTAFVIGISVVGYRSIINNVRIDNSIWNQVSYLDESNKDLLLAAYDTIQVVESIAPQSDVFFWRELAPAPINQPAVSITSLYMRSLIGNFPAIRNPWVDLELQSDMLIVLYSANGDILDDARDLLRLEGFEAAVIDVVWIERGRIRFNLTFLQIKELA
jgi:hypothetical protein